MIKPELAATPRQMLRLEALSRAAGVDDETLAEEIRRRFDVDLRAITRRQASLLISELGDRLLQRRERA